MGAVFWALVVVGIGYVFGETLTWLFGDFKRVEKWGFAVLLVTSVALAVVLHLRGRKRTQCVAPRETHAESSKLRHEVAPARKAQVVKA